MVDEDAQVCGIFTLRDVLSERGQQLIDYAFDKPAVSLLDPLKAVFEIMGSSENHFFAGF